MSIDGGPELKLTKPHFSCKVYRAYLTYLAKNYPEISIDEICREAGLSLDYLQNEDNFVSTIFDERFTRLCIEKTGDKDLCFHVGVQSISPDVMGQIVFFLIKNTISIPQIYAQIPKLTEVYSKVTRVELLDLSDRTASFRLYALSHSLNPDERESLKSNLENIFKNSLGHYAGAPTAQDLPPAHVNYRQWPGPDGLPIYEMNLRFERNRPLLKISAFLIPILATSISLALSTKFLHLDHWTNWGLLTVGICLVWLWAGRVFFHQLKSRFDSAIRAVQNADQRYASLLSTQEELKQVSDSYKKFVPWEFIDLFELKNFTDLRLGAHQEREMTILFLDIRHFTKMVERMAPAEVLVFLNSFFASLAPIVRLNGGFIDKYTGDGFMAIFPHSPAEAIRAAVAIQRKLHEMNLERGKMDREIIKVGIGINSGSVTLGTVGYKDQMQNTVLSDVVNVASRLETETKYWGCRILVSEKTIVDSDLKDQIGCRFIGRMSLKGKDHPVLAYEVFEDLPEASRDLLNQTKADLEYAIHLFEAGDLTRAKQIFEALALRQPEDPIVRMYLSKFVEATSSSASRVRT